jgi:hypothetical protein
MFDLIDENGSDEHPLPPNEPPRQQSHELLLLRHVLDAKEKLPGLWAGCDWKESRTVECQHMLKKFGPLMMIGNQNNNNNHHPNTIPKIITSQVDPSLQIPVASAEDTKTTKATTPRLKSRYVCAKQGLAGLGALTDHGTLKLHGWTPEDYGITHNHGRGGNFWSFRNFMMRNLGLPATPTTTTTVTEATKAWNEPPFNVIFAMSSTESSSRNVNFDPYMYRVKQMFPSNMSLYNSTASSLFFPTTTTTETTTTIPAVNVQGYKFQDYSLKNQIEIVSQSAIYVTACGGGTVTAIFLPRGASLIIFYLEDGGIASNRNTNEPARLDWDMWNNINYIRVHWIPVGTSFLRNDQQAFLRLMLHELQFIQEEAKHPATPGSSTT